MDAEGVARQGGIVATLFLCCLETCLLARHGVDQGWVRVRLRNVTFSIDDIVWRAACLECVGGCFVEGRCGGQWTK